MMNLKDHEVASFNDEAEFKERIKNMCSSDIWQRCAISELSVSALENCPIAYSSNPTAFCIEHNLDPELDEYSVLSTMEDIKLLLHYPLEKMVANPVRWTAFKTLCDRAGLTGPALSCFANKSRQKEMAPENKSVILNYGLECFSGSNALVLVRDEKVSAVLSGDEADYSILRQDMLVDELSESIRESFSGVSFSNACLAHDITTVQYVIADTAIVTKYRDILSKSGKETKSVIPTVVLTTSDVGLCGANITPFIVDGSTKIPVGDGLKLPHKQGKTIADFRKNCDAIMAMFIESLNNITTLAETEIRNPLGCFIALCKRQNLPKAESVSASEDFSIITEGKRVTALDVYLAIAEIIEAYVENQIAAGKTVPPAKMVFWQEQVARILTYNFKDYDHFCTWE